MAPEFAVVIPTLNEQSYLGPLLDDLVHQTRPPEQVIVSDSSSSDKTLEVARKFAPLLPLTIVGGAKRTPGAARNTGAQVANKDYITFIDADFRLPINFFELLDKTARSNPDFISPLFKTEGRHPFDHLHVFAINSYTRWCSRFGKVAGMGGLMCVKRTVHQQIGGFNHELLYCDDIDYLNKLMEAGVSSELLDVKVLTSNRRLEKYGRAALALRRLRYRRGYLPEYGDYE